MKNNISNLFIVLIFLSKQDIMAQIDSLPPYPSAKEVRPTVIASTNKEDAKYIFGYTVANGVDALQHIWTFFVEIKSKSFNSMSPTDWHSSLIRRDSITAITWGSEDSLADIAAGKSLRGFKIVSTGLPGVVRFFAHGFLEPPEGEIEYQSGSNDVLVNSVQGITLGPMDPPVFFVPISFLDTLISYKHQSVTLGWLKTKRDDDCDEDEQPDDGVVNNLDKRLEKARKELSKRDSTKARKELEKFVKKVEKLRKRSEEAEQKNKSDQVVMTSEAYALLKFNAEYLIDGLPEKKPTKGSKEKD
jgi:hypothetical protein